MLAVYITEISNPVMTGRHILRLSGRRYTFAYELCEISFLALYTWGRAIANWSPTYYTMKCKENHIWFKFTCIGLTVQSLFFVNKMKTTMMRRLNEIQKRR